MEIGNLMMKISANSASWGGDREYDDDDDGDDDDDDDDDDGGGEQCGLGWR